MEVVEEVNVSSKKGKKKGKKRHSGGGQDVDQETFEYFQRVLENLENQGFEDDEEKGGVTVYHSEYCH
jgi:hypothetical protein